MAGRLSRFIYGLDMLRTRVVRPLTAGARVILVKDGKVMLVHHTYMAQWYLPGGGVRKGETLEETARREAREEVGAEMGKLNLLGVYSNFEQHKSDHVAVFICDDFRLKDSPSAEIDSAAFYATDDLPNATSPGTRRRIEEWLAGQRGVAGAVVSSMALHVRPLAAQDKAWVTDFLTEHAGSPRQAAHGIVHQADEQPGFAAFEGDVPAGLATYVIDGDQCELATIYAAARFSGTGTALLQAVKTEAAKAGCRRLWLITTNDNVDALRFYQRRGMRLVAVHAGAVDRSRESLKPEIPTTGSYDIPLRDEIELETLL